MSDATMLLTMPQTDAEYDAVLNQMRTEMLRMNEQIRRDDEEIGRLRQETQALKSEAQVLRADAQEILTRLAQWNKTC